MSGVQHRAVKPDDDGMRLDRWFRKYFTGLTHSRLEKLLRQGRIRLDGTRAKANDRVQTGQQVRVPPEVPRDGQSPTPASGRVWPSLVEGLRASVIHRDQHLLVLNKPSGLAVQGGSKTSQHVDGVLPELTFGAPEVPRLVHRLALPLFIVRQDVAFRRFVKDFPLVGRIANYGHGLELALQSIHSKLSTSPLRRSLPTA